MVGVGEGARRPDLASFVSSCSRKRSAVYHEGTKDTGGRKPDACRAVSQAERSVSAAKLLDDGLFQFERLDWS